MRTARLKNPSAPAHVPLTARLVRVPLVTAKSPSDMLRAAGPDDRPFALLGAWSAGAALVGSDPLVIREDPDDPFAVVDEMPEMIGAVDGATGGGWVGYFGYGLGKLVEHLPPSPHRPVAVPRSILAFYDHVLRLDEAGRWWFEALWSHEQSDRLESLLSKWRRRTSETAPDPGEFACETFLPNPEPEVHRISVARAIEHIRSGDVFQVNVCTRLEAGFSGSPLELFCVGAERLEPRFGAYLGHPSLSVASFSPELFLRRRGHHVVSSPIKGTARRHGSSVGQRERLLGSDKDRAENVMIVDLMRNDLGRVCGYGSVRVPELCRAEEHPGVWHLVSDVTGELSSGASDAALLRATFPPGSVTGAPKVRAMELVTALETTAREVYTGAIGIVSPLSGLELNVAIRTFELAGAKAWLGVGGGIVADSDPDRELEECLDKARPLLAAVGAELGSRRPEHRRWTFTTDQSARRSVDLGSGVFETILILEGRPVDLESHLARLSESVACLYGTRPPARLGADVLAVASGRSGSHRLQVRVHPSPGGQLVTELTISPAPEAFAGASGRSVALAPVVLPGGLGRHKWSDRRVLFELRNALGLGPHEQLLLVDEDGAVLETERANIFAASGGVARTPPADDRILPGTTREIVIRSEAVKGLQVSVEVLKLEDLVAADEIFLTSAISGLVPVSELRPDHSFRLGPIGALVSEAIWACWRGGVATSRTADRYAPGQAGEQRVRNA